MRTLSYTKKGFNDNGFSKSLMLHILIHVIGDLH